MSIQKFDGTGFAGAVQNGVTPVFHNNAGNQIYCYGTNANLPSGIANFAVGCIYRADDTGNLFRNVGTTSSCSFFPIAQIQTPATTAAINATATATAAQVATGYITSTSAASTTITLPTGTLLGTALNATQGTTLDLYIDNTAGASTVTIAVATNGILSAAAAAGSSAGAGLLTVPSGVTGLACFRLIFSSATAYVFSRVA